MSKVTPASEPAFAAFIAIDWADREHVWAMEIPGSQQREAGRLEHTPEAIELWAVRWATRFNGRPVAVALEQARGALVYALSKYKHLVIYPIHPSTSHDFRKAVFPSGTKDDPKDAEILLDLLLRHRDRLRVLNPDTEQTRKLQSLVEKRRQLVDERTAFTNRITGQLKLYFPQVLRWFDKLDAPILAAFLQRWPRLNDVQQASPDTLRKFFTAHHSRSHDRIEERLVEIQQARPAITDAAVIDPAVLMVQTFLQVVEVLREAIKKLDKAIDQEFNAHPDHSIFDSFPSAGPVMAPRLLVAFGSQRDRFAAVNEVLSFSGIAPVKSQSGSSRWIHFRWKCPKFVRQTFHEYAGLSIQQCEWAKAFYDQHRAKGKGHHAAVRALAFKWIRILFRCWQSGKAYDETVYLNAQLKRQAPRNPRPKDQQSAAPQGSGKPVKLQLKKVGDFTKLGGITA